MEKTQDNWEDYFYPGTKVLKNNLGIMDASLLREKEIELTFARQVELIENPIEGNFDAEHLKNIHYYLFQDVYPFAGKYRVVNIEKNHYGFADYQLISQKIDEELLLMHQDSQTISSKYEFACHLARYYVELLAIHPFREGNGRSIREFIREYAIEQSKKYSFGPCDFLWSNVDTNTINETIQFSLAYRSFIELQFLKALVSLSFDEKIRVER